MKDLIEDFKTIYRNDRYVLVVMLGLLAVSAALVLMPLFHLSPDTPKIWARYADLNKGYAEGDWWYLISFSLMGLVLGVGHCLLGAKLYSKRGGAVTVLFLAISIAAIAIGVSVLAKILGEA